MVTDQEVRKLMKLIQSEKSLALAAAKAGMDEKTAGKYRRLGRLPMPAGPHLDDPAGPLCRGVAGDSGAAPVKPWFRGEDDF